MGKHKKAHNWKARSQKDVCIDRSEETKINVELAEADHQQYDDANALVLPAKKRATKLKGPQPPPVKKLSRKQRKRLEKILEQKEKKQKRASLLEALKTVQVSKEELSQLQSTTQLHNQAYKRRLDTSSDNTTNVNPISGSNKKRKKQMIVEEDTDQNESSEESSSELSDSECETSVDENDDDVHETKSEGRNNGKEPNAEAATDKNKDSKDIKTPSVSSEAAVNSHTVKHVPIQRDPAIQAERLKLPIIGEEQVIMETISENAVTILCGETGSGKTTQIPQFLYEAGYAQGGNLIAVTEPRRVAAISMANRVGREMNLTQREVSYQIRYEGTVTLDTKIKFLTDGVLLKEVQKDFLLSRYSVVVIDEAHERSMYTDILIGLLSRIVPLRHKKGNPLKMIIMSATLRVEDFTENAVLFKTPPPVVKVDSRQFPVTVHFNKRTPEDYLTEAFKKVCKIHRELPEGGILVFVTGQQEVHTLVAKLARFFPYKASKTKADKKSVSQTRTRKSSTSLPDMNLDAYSILPEDEEAELNDSERKIDQLDVEDGDNYDDNLNTDEENSDDDDSELNADISSSSNLPLYTLPLYSLLSTKKQQKVFEPPPEGCRLCVIATNVAETSITIPGIRYVVDTGKTKTKFYDKVTGVSAFKVTWTSKASSNQRAGRAGRTGPGHCYRLYSSAVYNDELEQFSPPEIVRRPVDDLVLQMKAMCIDKVVNFPFPTPPSEESMQAAEQLLIALGALKLEKDNKSSRITPLGQTMAAFPVSPRYGKMLSLGQQEGLLAYVVTVVAALSVQELLVEAHGEEDEKQSKQALMQLKRNWAGVGESLLLGDVSVLLHAVGACEYSGGTEDFCARHSIRYKAMVEIRKLRKQLTDTVNTVLPNIGLAVNPKLAPPGELQCKLLRQILLAGLGDRVAKKLPPDTLGQDGKKLKNAYKCTTTDDLVYIHPSSVLYKQQPQYLVYQSLEETSKLYMKGVSAVDLSWLPVFVPHYCVFSKPQDEPKPRYDKHSGQVMCHMTCTFGAHTWPIPAVELPFPHSLECFKWFAVFILDGSVCPTLAKYKSSLLSLPVTMIKSWAKLQPRTECFLRTLTNANAYNEEMLKKAFEKNPQYLLNAYKDWLPQALHSQIEKMWPPIDG